MFAPGGPWATPSMERVAPIVIALSERFAERIVFTRFITPERPDDMPGLQVAGNHSDADRPGLF
jgi:hypothetical protein